MIRLLAALLVLLAACSTPPASDTPTDPAPEGPGIDRIVVTYSPSGRMQSDDVQSVTIDEPERIALWMSVLAAVPDQPERGIRYIRFGPSVPEHRVQFFSGEEVVEFRRLKGGHMDVAEAPGWAFYSGEDEEFAALVTEAAPTNRP
ncbi:MAG: hypothetical protein AAF196_00585 [Planctomycetota bacterium]